MIIFLMPYYENMVDFWEINSLFYETWGGGAKFYYTLFPKCVNEGEYVPLNAYLPPWFGFNRRGGCQPNLRSLSLEDEIDV